MLSDSVVVPMRTRTACVDHGHNVKVIVFATIHSEGLIWFSVTVSSGSLTFLASSSFCDDL